MEEMGWVLIERGGLGLIFSSIPMGIPWSVYLSLENMKRDNSPISSLMFPIFAIVACIKYLSLFLGCGYIMYWVAHAVMLIVGIALMVYVHPKILVVVIGFSIVGWLLALSEAIGKADREYGGYS